MNQTNTEILISKYPKCFSKTKSIGCDDGWFILLNHLFSEIEKYINRLPLEFQEQIFIEQVKQKFASLRVYMSKSTPHIEAAISMATAISSTTCEKCGNLGKENNENFWLIVLCNLCYEKGL